MSNCFICRDSKTCRLLNHDRRFPICPECESNFFPDVFDEQAIEITLKARELAKEYNLSFGLALNAARGRYSLQEALKRQDMKRRARQGKTNDIFSFGKRMPGSFH